MGFVNMPTLYQHVILKCMGSRIIGRDRYGSNEKMYRHRRLYAIVELATNILPWNWEPKPGPVPRWLLS